MRNETSASGQTILNRILSCIIIVLIIVIAAVTVLAPRTARKEETPQRTSFRSAANEKQRIADLGQLRITTKPGKDGKTSVLIATPCLEYTEDRDFYEELDRKTSKIKALIEEYFMGKTLQEINEKGEDAVNEELLSRINSTLVLQKIKRIYFLDYQFL